MLRGPLKLTLCALLSFVVSPLANSQEISFAPCALTGSGGNGNLHAECATWQRPLDPAKPNDEKIELFIAKLKSTSNTPAEDAFTIINGGPGGSSIDMMIQFAPLLSAFTRERDVLVIDQRGTGRSSRLTCEGIADDPESYDPEKVPELIQACLARLPFDPNFFTTSAAVEDLEAMRAELGYSQLSIYGVSYGTRVAQHFMRRYPNSARAVIIDGVVPPTEVLGSQIAVHSQEALDKVFAQCAEKPECADAFGDVKASFEFVSTKLREAPIPMTLPHPVTGITTELELGHPHLVAWLRFSLYAPETTALIPVILNEAVKHQSYTPIASNALRMLHNITTSMAYGMHNAVVCTEDAPFYASEEVDFDALSATYIGREMYDTLSALCVEWPRGYMHDSMKQPLQSAVPTLVLSGENDPITPPAWGEAVMPGLSNAIHIIAPGQGHGTIGRGCMPKLIEAFVEDPDPNQIDSACIERLQPFPFFVDLLGPKP
ncbi:MAG: alpha/beta fold hydrolase [Pseudomonadales bacterium]|nr:alpha/beta fold hydrolase [Pseudomonadales bacterium]